MKGHIQKDPLFLRKNPPPPGIGESFESFSVTPGKTDCHHKTGEGKGLCLHVLRERGGMGWVRAMSKKNNAIFQNLAPVAPNMPQPEQGNNREGQQQTFFSFLRP